LIIKPVDRDNADDIVFGSNNVSYNGWSYGITDLVTGWAVSNSRTVHPTPDDCQQLLKNIKRYQPRVIVILHYKVQKSLKQCFKLQLSNGNYGQLGYWLGEGIKSEVFSVPFPHGNRIPKQDKVALYKQIKNYLITVIEQSQIAKA
jgi:hypothetical protein